MSEENFSDFGSLFHPAARLELLDAIEYYRNKSPDLARTFYEDIERCLKELLEFPELAPVKHPVGVRSQPLHRFPYSVLYTVDPDVLYIVAIAHQKRRPNYWLRRLGLEADS